MVSIKSQEGNEMQQLVFAGTQVKTPVWLSSAQQVLVQVLVRSETSMCVCGPLHTLLLTLSAIPSWSLCSHSQ